MKDDHPSEYLWDKTGLADPEVQQLEELLGTLRYQPRPLEIPAELKPRGQRFAFHSLAAAAAIGMLLLSAGLWLGLRKPAAPGIAALTSGPQLNVPAEGTTVQPTRPASQVVSSSSDKQARTQKIRPHSNPQSPAGRASNRHRTLVADSRPLTARERAEAEDGKRQLLLALRVASAKLTLAQKKTQGGYPKNLIRNHKTG